MFNTIIELNNVRKDANYITNADAQRLHSHSAIVEVFSAMANGEEISKFGVAADKAVKHIKSLGERAESGDTSAIAELNTIRRYVIEAPVLQEMKLFNVFGSFEQVGFDESIEREVYNYAGEGARLQANNGDVPFIAPVKTKYPVGTKTVSGGYQVDYRRVKLGDMSKENEGMAIVRTMIYNKAINYILVTVYNAIKNATGVKYTLEAGGLTKAGVDDVIAKVRPNGKPTVFGAYGVVSQFTPWAGYVGSIASNTILGMSQKVMDEIASRGLLATYNGTNLVEIPNPYNEYELNAAGTNFEKLNPEGLALVVPTGVESPIKTWVRGGLTSMTGEDVKTGKLISRYDLEIAVDVAKGKEHKIGTMLDTNLSTL